MPTNNDRNTHPDRKRGSVRDPYEGKIPVSSPTSTRRHILADLHRRKDAQRGQESKKTSDAGKEPRDPPPFGHFHLVSTPRSLDLGGEERFRNDEPQEEGDGEVDANGEIKDRQVVTGCPDDERSKGRPDCGAGIQKSTPSQGSVSDNVGKGIAHPKNSENTRTLFLQ